MIRVGSTDGCGCGCEVVDREAAAVSKDVNGVVKGDCLLEISGGVSLLV